MYNWPTCSDSTAKQLGLLAPLRWKYGTVVASKSKQRSALLLAGLGSLHVYISVRQTDRQADWHAVIMPSNLQNIPFQQFLFQQVSCRKQQTNKRDSGTLTCHAGRSPQNCSFLTVLLSGAGCWSWRRTTPQQPAPSAFCCQLPWGQ